MLEMRQEIRPAEAIPSAETYLIRDLFGPSDKLSTNKIHEITHIRDILYALGAHLKLDQNSITAEDIRLVPK